MASESTQARPYFRKLAALLLAIGVVGVPFILWMHASTGDWMAFALWLVFFANVGFLFYSIAAKGRLPRTSATADTSEI